MTGNLWAKNTTGKMNVITNAGIENWTKADVEVNTNFGVSKPGTIHIKMKAKIAGQSLILLNINGVKRELTIQNPHFSLYDAGEWEVSDTGYIRITFTAVSKTGQRFADVSEYEISGTAIDSKVGYVKSNEGNFFY